MGLKSGVFSVHPRVCGEQETDPTLIDQKTRSIPACAGNSQGSTPFWKLTTGPSPRVRGTAPLKLGIYASFRSIPACAGNRLGNSSIFKVRT